MKYGWCIDLQHLLIGRCRGDHGPFGKQHPRQHLRKDWHKLAPVRGDLEGLLFDAERGLSNAYTIFSVAFDVDRQADHPIAIIKQAIYEYFEKADPAFKTFDNLQPIVTAQAVCEM